MTRFSDRRPGFQEEIKRLKAEHPDFGPLGDLLGSLAAWLDTPNISLSPSAREWAVREGRILLELVPLEIDSQDLSKRWEKIVNSVEEQVPLPEGAAARLGSLDAGHLLDLCLVLPSDPGKAAGDLAGAVEISGDLAAFLLVQAAGPFYQAQARALSLGPEIDLWTQGFCPVCGAHPHYGRLEAESGARILECWVCGTGWSHPRLTCPYCENSQQRDLGFFCLEGDDCYRIHFCRQCDQYLKVVDCRQLGREVLLCLANIATLSHDLAAKGQGFRPGSRLDLVG